MKLTELATEPKLVKILIDDEDTVKEYDEAVEFWCFDRQPLNKFVKFATAKEQDPELMFDFCQDLILDEEGNKVMVDGKVLPAQLMMRAIAKVVEVLGK